MKLSDRVVKIAEKPVATTPALTPKNVATRHGKYKNPEERKAKMREYQRKRRAKVKMPTDEQFMAALGPCGK